MHQGRFAFILLCVALLASELASATSISREDAQQWLKNSQVSVVVDQLYDNAAKNDTEKLVLRLESLSMPNQEIARYLLLKKLEASQFVLSPDMAAFVLSQTKHSPAYTIEESGNGYQTMIPAFNSSVVATRLMRVRSKTQSNLDFILSVEERNLELHQWLQGSDSQIKQRESLLISSMDSLSPQAISYLVNQIAGDKVIQWLPTSAVMVKLAEISQDPRIYHLLWRMKRDVELESEVNRLAAIGDAFSIQQLVNAADNPALKSLAVMALVKIKPMPIGLEQFFVARLNQDKDRESLRSLLIENGYGPWLQRLGVSGLIPRGPSLVK